jgi:hypothetical protein
MATAPVLFKYSSFQKVMALAMMHDDKMMVMARIIMKAAVRQKRQNHI